MKTSEDEPWPGVNERLRPRKPSCAPSPKKKSKKKTDGKAQGRFNRTSTLTKISPSKQNDLSTKSDFSSTLRFLCPYCDRKFSSRQPMSKHIRRIHLQISKSNASLRCLFCNHSDAESGILRHMVDNHPNEYFACLDCHLRFYSTFELAEHKLSVCEKQKPTYRNKLHQKVRGKKRKKSLNNARKYNVKEFQDDHSFNGVVISCELKPVQDQDAVDIEDNITTNLILPSSRSLESSSVIEKNAVIVLNDIQWNKRIPPKFTFHSADPDQILSRLGVVHRSPRTGESTKKDCYKLMDESAHKFEKCFDTKFYSKVASNIQENITNFLDGACNFNPDTENKIRTRKTKNNVFINAAEGFPILLASEQYSRSALDGYQPRPIAPKHKWKWEHLESGRSVFNSNQMIRDTHTNNCIITLVSRLDLWTQLCMRRKYEEILSHNLPVKKRSEKQNIISKELKEILESKEIPTTSQIVRYTSAPAAISTSSTVGFPMAIGLMPAPTAAILRPAVLSGEWVRPRCYMCCACGQQTSAPKGLSTHITISHPNAHVQYYEIVGEKLLNSDILKYLYVPPSQVSNRTRLPRGFKECTKCNNSVSLEELHQHMLECAGDTPIVRRRHCRHRPFGVRRRRPKIPENIIQKKILNDIRIQPRQKNRIGSKPRIRTEVGDAETIRKMLAGLPAKRHRVLVNPISMIPNSRRKLDRSRNKLITKPRSTEDRQNRSCKCSSKQTSSGVKMRSQGNDDCSVRAFSPDDDKPLKFKSDSKTRQPNYENRLLKIRRTTNIKKKNIQLESLRRQKLVTPAKIKSMRIRKIIPTTNCEIADKTVGASTNKTMEFTTAAIEVSITKPRQRLDVKKASYNKREQANPDSSDNGNSQMSGSSGVGGTRNKPYVSVPNVPLKHSIARLTASSETHDKSVQFHHLFLVQQECNNTNQHAISGLTPLFENETVVTRLDKPPLRSGFVDVQPKSKTNKLKKGLNDCIAMLKNKLIEAKTCQTTGNVSVQCSSAEFIDIEPTTIKAASVNDAAQVRILSERDSDGVIQDCTSKVVGEFAKPEQQQDLIIVASPVPKGKFHETVSITHTTDEQEKAEAVQFFPKDPVLHTVITCPKHTIETSLTDKQVPVKKVETFVKTKTLRPIGTEAPKSTSLTSISKGHKNPLIFASLKPIDNQHNLIKNNFNLEAISNSTTQLEDIDTLCLNSAVTDLRTETATVLRKSVESNFSLRVFPKQSLLESNLSIERALSPSTFPNLYDMPRRNKSKVNKNPKISEDARGDSEEQSKSQLNDRIYTESGINMASKISTSAVYISTSAKCIYSNRDKQGPCRGMSVDCKLNPLNSVDDFTERRIRDIRPVHASTNVDSITAAPLDLSSKVSACKSPSNLDLCYNINHENLETLDLSKNKQVHRILNIFTAKDEVVDLRVKLTQNEISDLCCVTTSNHVHAMVNMSHHFPNYLNYPTDLSVNGKDTSMVPFPSSCASDITKDFSKSKPMFVETEHRYSSPSSEISPANWSEKIVKLSSQGSLSTSVTDLSDLVLKSPVKGILDDNTSKFTSQKTCEESKLFNYADQLSRVEQLRATEKQVCKPLQDRYSSLILKPVYDPTLKIPQYKIRNKASTETSLTEALAEAKTSVCSLTDTIIGDSNHHDGTNNEFFNGPASVQNRYSTTFLHSDLAFQPVSQIPTISKQNASNKIHTTETDEDSDTARKITMLPQELVAIIGSVPVGQRKQLLEILPQYVSTFREAGSVENDSVLPNDALNMEEQEHELANNTSIIESSLRQHDVCSGIEKIHEPKEYKNKTHTGILLCPKDLGTKSSNPTLNLISGTYFSDPIKIQKNVIDLTEDDILPPVTLDSSFSTPIPTPGISDPVVKTINASSQRSDDKKTTSLRTVRMKAPSERQKENKLLRKEAIAQAEIQKIPEPAGGIYRESVGSINALAIQQAEISSTQQSELSRIKLKHKSIIPIKSTEVNKLNLDEMFTKTSLYLGTEKDTAPNHLNSSPFNESKKIISGSVGDRYTTSSNYISEVGIVAHDNVSPSLMKEIIKPSPNESDSNMVVAHIFEKAIQLKNAQLVKSNVTVDGDSEDDLILSTIREIKFTETKNEKSFKQDTMTTNKRNTKRKKKKRNKQGKRIIMVDDCRKPVIGIDDAQIKQGDNDRKKLRHRRINTKYYVHQINKKPKQETTNDEGSECKDVSDKNTTQELQVCEVAVTEKQRVENILTVQEVTKKQNTKQPKRARGEEISKNGRQVSTDKEKSIVGIPLRETVLLPIDRQSDLSRIAVKDSNNKMHNTVTKTIKDLTQDIMVIEEIKDLKMSHASFKQKKNNESYRCTNETSQILKNESVGAREHDNNVKTPLRRSQRGKSLYKESNNTISQKDNLNTDMIAEHKAPLPKKQLIFSKLLHDEPIHNKSLNISPEKELQKHDTVNDPNLFLRLGLTAITLSNHSPENKPRKFNKQKQSNKLKRKCKKEKHVRFRDISKISIKTDDLEYADKNFLDHSFKYINCTPGCTDQIMNQKVTAQEESISTLKVRAKFHRKNEDIISADVSVNIEENSKQTNLLPQKRKISNATSSTVIETDPVPITKKAKLSINSGLKILKIGQSRIKTTCNMGKKSIRKSKKAKHCTGKELKNPEILQNSTDIKRISNPKAASVMDINAVHVPIPKKGKLNIDRESATPEICQSTAKTESIFVTVDSNINASRCINDNKTVITCYDVPIAARRTRSKSVGVTSSTAEVHDPYDIDLDDMIQIGPLRKSMTKQAKIKGPDMLNISDFKTQSHINSKVKKEYRLKLNLKSNKQEKLLFESKKGHSSVKLKSTNFKNKGKSASSKYKSSLLQTQKVENGSDCVISSKRNISPLKKFVEDETMKSNDTQKIPNVYVQANDIGQVVKTSKRGYKKNRRSSVTYGNSGVVAVESDERFRSERFMESFGFFSERKPRKSNLLAAKKISESFHIITNESDDSYLNLTYPLSKRTSEQQAESNKNSADKKKLQMMCKKSKAEVFVITNCDVCKTVFRRPDNYVRHLLSSVHLIKLAKQKLNLIVLIAPQRPNCLVFLRESTKMLQHKLEISQSDIEGTQKKVPNFAEMIIEVFKKAKILHLSRHDDHSRNEDFLLDCCEILRDLCDVSSGSTHEAMPLEEEDVEEDAEANKKYLQFLEREIQSPKPYFMESTATRYVTESDKVRNSEREIICGLKDVAYKNAESHQAAALIPTQVLSLVKKVNYSRMDMENQIQQYEKDNYRNKKYPEYKEKLYPDIEEINVYEDKFDKIKRKCRSQAAAAKQNMQIARESITEGHKGRRKLKNKKRKFKLKKTYQNSVVTKGALKGFDVIKVSIPTTDLNLGTVVPPKKISHKKKTEIISKKKRMKNVPEISNKYGCDFQVKDNCHTQKKVDVYEFMDNEDFELFEFRPSSLIDRFKVVSNIEMPNMSKRDMPRDQVDNSSVSGSDGDDFVYMSDDYVCNDDDTENSLLSCELSSVQSDTNKVSLFRRKDFVKKNALMGKIFKHNAVRSEEKPVKGRQSEKANANLDQLFDSLLDEEPTPALSIADKTDFSKKENGKPSVAVPTSPEHKIFPRSSSKSLDMSSEKICKLSKEKVSRRSNTPEVLSKNHVERNPSPSKLEIPRWYDSGPSKYIDVDAPHEANNMVSSTDYKTYETADDLSETQLNTISRSEFIAEPEDDSGVARQRARRKCTVGKQNVLAEIWSSESELDVGPTRLNGQSCAHYIYSAVSGVSRRKKCRKKCSQHFVGRRRYKLTHHKKQDVEGVNRNHNVVSGSSVTGGFGGGGRVYPLPVSGTSRRCSLSGCKPRRPIADYNWSAKVDDEQEHQPQHGWIVGDSHKKLVTMLAHAKGRKRYNDDKRHMVE